MPDGLPTGTVTFLFTDIEGSTTRWEYHPQPMQEALARHDAILRQAISAHNGYIFKTIGDEFCAAFAVPTQAMLAVLEAQRALQAEQWDTSLGPVQVRMALHTGVAEVRDGDYFGQPVNRVARLLTAAHGGQMVLSLPTEELVRDAVPSGVVIEDLGEHRLKDLARPERVFQFVLPGLPTHFPPLRTLDNCPNNLPLQPTPFLGREKELAALTKLILREDVRLLTLIGPGGVGKTRLALQLAAEVIDHFDDGVFFVSLATTSDPQLFASAVAQTLGVKEAGDQPAIQVLKHHLSNKRMLLILDNFERIADAAPQLSEIMLASPRLTVLVSSRVVLHLRSEKEFSVSPLSLPPMPTARRHASLEALSQYEAVALFIQRAMDVHPDFAITNDNAPAVAEVCIRLDGLPLAIELAAARIRLLTPQAMLARLQSRLKLLTGGALDLPDRQRTLRGAIEWSYDLLEPEEQQLFKRLAVFQGGRTLEAIETVCNYDGKLQVDVLDGVESLVAKSLLRQARPEQGDASASSEPRFVMLETIHEYAWERLVEGGAGENGEAQALQRQHAIYFLALAEEAEGHLQRPEQVEWMDHLEIEHDNLRAALGWALEEGHSDVERTEIGLRLAGALGRFWSNRGYLSEGRRWLERALDAGRRLPKELLPEGGSPATLKRWAKALYEAGFLSWRQADFKRGTKLLEEALALYERLGDRSGTAYSLSALGIARAGLDEAASAESLWEQSLAIFRELGDTAGMARSLNNLGESAKLEGDYERAGQFYEEALSFIRTSGDRYGLAIVLLNLGLVRRRAGDNAGATEFFRGTLEIAREVGSNHHISASLDGLAGVAGAEGQPERAARLFGAGEAMREVLGTPIETADRDEYDRALSAARAQLDEAAWQKARDEGRAMSVEQAIAYALQSTVPS